jgi:hypothetical protein
MNQAKPIKSSFSPEIEDKPKPLKPYFSLISQKGVIDVRHRHLAKSNILILDLFRLIRGRDLPTIQSICEGPRTGSKKVSNKASKMGLTVAKMTEKRDFEAIRGYILDLLRKMPKSSQHHSARGVFRIDTVCVGRLSANNSNKKAVT